LQSGARVKIEFRNIDLTIFDYYWTQENYTEIFQKAGLHIIEIHNPLGMQVMGMNGGTRQC